jgi:hypothetical protein
MKFQIISLKGIMAEVLVGLQFRQLGERGNGNQARTYVL